MTDTYSLINLAREGDKTAEKKLVDDNILLVHSCVRKLMHPDYEYEDLVQVGSIGLVKAIRRFDTSLGLRLSTYAVPLIMGEIKRYIRDNSSLKVSRSLRELWIKASKVRQILSAELFREPTIGEIAERLGTDTERLTLAMEAAMPCDSLNRPIGGDGKDDIYIQDVVKSPKGMDDEIDKIALKNAIANLGEREKKIILLRYFRGKTQTEVSRIIGVSQVQISRIEKRVLATLRNSIE